MCDNSYGPKQAAKHTQRSLACAVAPCLALLIGAVGCGDAASVAEPLDDIGSDSANGAVPVDGNLAAVEVQGSAPERTEAIATLIESVSLGADHRIEFWQLESGAAFAYETMSLDAGEPSIIQARSEQSSLADIYRKVASDHVPVELLNADLLAELGTDEARSEVALNAAELSAQNDQLNVSAGTPGLDFAVAGQALSGDLPSCSDDLLNDNWGAQWFLDLYCTFGEFTYCDTNRLLFTSIPGLGFKCGVGNWFQFSVMNGDFSNHSTRLQGSYWDTKKKKYVLAFDKPVEPRRISTIAYRTPNGTTMCLGGEAPIICRPHTHYAMGYYD